MAYPRIKLVEAAVLRAGGGQHRVEYAAMGSRDHRGEAFDRPDAGMLQAIRAFASGPSERPANGPAFQLSLLGPFELIGPAGPIDLGSKKLCGLVALLACAPVAQPREKLMALLWGSRFEAQARQSMRKALSRLRQTLHEDIIVSSGDNVSLRPAAIVSDVQRVESAVRLGSRSALRSVVGLYKDALLANVSIREEGWTHWLTAQRQRVETLAVDAWIRLGEEELAYNDAHSAFVCGQSAVAIDPLREDAHRIIIRALAANGRRAEALRQYNRLAGLLKHDLDVSPDASTNALAREIRNGGLGEDISGSFSE
jgi:DNA-binding SARP family transcriptional activator